MERNIKNELECLEGELAKNRIWMQTFNFHTKEYLKSYKEKLKKHKENLIKYKKNHKKRLISIIACLSVFLSLNGLAVKNIKDETNITNYDVYIEENKNINESTEDEAKELICYVFINLLILMGSYSMIKEDRRELNDLRNTDKDLNNLENRYLMDLHLARNELIINQTLELKLNSLITDCELINIVRGLDEGHDITKIEELLNRTKQFREEFIKLESEYKSLKLEYK